MAKMRINASSLFTKHTLEVTDTGVVWIETAFGGGKKTIPFGDIDAVLRSPGALSLQVGRATHQIAIKPSNAQHAAVIARLVAACRQTVRRSAPSSQAKEMS